MSRNAQMRRIGAPERESGLDFARRRAMEPCAIADCAEPQMSARGLAPAGEVGVVPAIFGAILDIKGGDATP
jgi:hypothetical protein